MAKAKKARAPRAKVRKQQFIPGTEPPVVQAIEDAAENYFEVMTERVKLSKEEDEKKTALIEVMKENGVDRYECQATGLVVTVTAKSNVTCKKKKGDPDSNGEAGDDE